LLIPHPITDREAYVKALGDRQPPHSTTHTN